MGKILRKTDRQGRLLIGKDQAQEYFFVERQEDGSILLRIAEVKPRNEKPETAK